MELIQYLKSKIFLRQFIIAVVLFSLLVFLALNMLSYITNHNQEITVPDLGKMTVEAAAKKLDEINLEHVLLDTLEYDKDFPQYGIVTQEPKAGSKVKEGRKIYLKINADGYKSVTLPDLIQKTIRQAEPTLRVLGLEVGTITYKPDLGKDMVLEMKIDGKRVKPGIKVMKTTKVDLVLGDGKIGFDESEIDNFQDNHSEEDE